MRHLNVRSASHFADSFLLTFQVPLARFSSLRYLLPQSPREFQSRLFCRCYHFAEFQGRRLSRPPPRLQLVLLVDIQTRGAKGLLCRSVSTCLPFSSRLLRVHKLCRRSANRIVPAEPLHSLGLH